MNAFAVNDALRVKMVQDQVALRELLEAAALINLSKRPTVRIGTATQAVYTGSVASVMECIKAHESGNYTEHSHPDNGGSGAYQYLRSTWAVWSTRAGYPGYAYPYQAPPAVQDAVTEYALLHGGAGNWSPRYGNDPCTVGIGG